MDKLFIIVLSISFTLSFVIIAIIITKPSLKKFLASFVGDEKPNVKHAEAIKRLIDEYREG